MEMIKDSNLPVPIFTSPAEELEKQLIKRFWAPGYRPPILSSTASKLLIAVRDHRISFPEIAKIVEQDPFVSGYVLRTAQSPMYMGRVKIQSIADALARLGLSTFRDIVWEAAISHRVFQSKEHPKLMESVRRHCVATGYISRIVANQVGLSTEEAFICGLLHDVGIPGILEILPSIHQSNEIPQYELWTVVHKVHSLASRMMARFWKLSMEVQIVLGTHHCFDNRSVPNPMSAVICVSEHITNGDGYSIEEPHDDQQEFGYTPALDQPSQTQFDLASQILNLTDTDFIQIINKTEQSLSDQII